MADPPSRHFQFVLSADEAGQRLDRVLAQRIPEMSRAAIQRLIHEAHVLRNGVPLRSPSAVGAGGDTVSVHVPPPVAAEPAPERIALAVVYEDDDLLVIDKPARMVVHPAAGHAGGTLVNALLAHCGDSLSGVGGVKRPGIVHRLDKDTTGLLVVAKNDRAHRSLAAQFADHGRTGPLRRAYLAVAWGVPGRPRLTIDAPLARSHANREKIDIDQSGRHAVTHVELLQPLGPPGAPEASLVRCTLETGRTHQIRVHLASIGHPLLGDPLYGSGFASKMNRLPAVAGSVLRRLHRQALHAAELSFEHPTSGQTISLKADLPADMQALVRVLLDWNELPRE